MFNAVSAVLSDGVVISRAPENESTTNLSVEPSVILNVLVPRVAAPAITTSPVPLVSTVRSPLLFVVEIVFPFKVMLSTFHISTLLAESTIAAEFAVIVPCP